MNRLRAFLIANGTFADKSIQRLKSPAVDATRLARLLSRVEVGGYKVDNSFDDDLDRVRERLTNFIHDSHVDDQILVYMSGHGFKDAHGRLYFAMRNTQLDRLASTALEARYIMERFQEGQSNKQLLILDTCYSGAFSKRAATKATETISSDEFDRDASGQVVITATSSVQLAGERDFDGYVQSVFTKHFIEGIETGAADIEGNGFITVDDLYHYVRQQMKRDAPGQTPQRWSYGLNGSLVIALNPAPKQLPKQITTLLESKLPLIRASAADLLQPYLADNQDGLRVAAIDALRRMQVDDSPVVQGVATIALGNRGLGWPPRRPASDDETEMPAAEASDRAGEFTSDHVVTLSAQANLLPPIKPIELVISSRHYSPSTAAELVKALVRMLDSIQRRSGIPLPAIELKLHPNSDEHRWRLLIHDIEVARGILDSALPNVLIEHVHQALRRNLPRFLALQEITDLLNEAGNTSPEAVKEAVRAVPTSRIAEVMRYLAEEEFPVRNIALLLEAVADAGQQSRDVVEIGERVRWSLRHYFMEQLVLDDKLLAIVLTKEFEQIVDRYRLEPQGGADSSRLPQPIIDYLVTSLSNLRAIHSNAFLVSAPASRRFLRDMLAPRLFDLPIVSFSELTPSYELHIVGELVAPPGVAETKEPRNEDGGRRD